MIARMPRRSTPVGRLIRRFVRHDSGAVAVEFGILALVFVTLLLGCLQFTLYYVAAMRMRWALAETVAYASVFSNTPFFSETRDQNQLRTTLCDSLVLTTNCTTTIKIEQLPLKATSASFQAIGTQFSTGVVGDVLVRRAEVPIVTFVPGVPTLKIRSSSIFLRR